MSSAAEAERMVETIATSAPRSSRIWITWEKQRRNTTISQALGCRLFEFDLKYSGLVRYPMALALTLITFIRERPTHIFVQNPSVVLSVFAVLYGRLLRIPVIVDTHNAGIEPLRRQPTWELAVARFILRHAALTILSNQALAETVQAEPGMAPVAVLPDPIPDLPPPAVKPVLFGRKNALFICTWAEDEPYLEVIKAAKLLPIDTYVYITGNSKNRLAHLTEPLPVNIVLTGYVDEATYVGLLHSCDVVVDLTTWEDCLLCGGYEAVSAERSVVLSGTAALRAYFHKGALYTDNTDVDLASKIEQAIAAQEELVEDVRALKRELVAQWQAQKEHLEKTLARLMAR
jgi:hypothetical protein